MKRAFQIGKNLDEFEEYLTKTARGLTTGFKEVDRIILGIPGLTAVMGEPKCCKSTFTMNIAIEKAKQGVRVLYLDTENGIQRLRLRMLSYLSGLPGIVIKSQRFTPEELYNYQQAKTEFEKLPITYIEGLESLQDVHSLLETIYNRGDAPVLFIVDSIQSLARDFKDRRASIDSWVFGFNDLKQQYEGRLTILLVSEKQRAAYGIASRAGAKESGGIEYKSEMVLDLRPHEELDKIIVECLYNRDGDTGVVANLIKPNPYTYQLHDAEYLPE